MDDMVKIVTEHVRASDLPAHLRGGLPTNAMVWMQISSTHFLSEDSRIPVPPSLTIVRLADFDMALKDWTAP
jgi:hypothetical protein